MELKQLESFTAVVECESFTRAAEKLFISQPTVSAHVRALEEELHSRLIVRTTKSIQVTPRGRELYECACGMLTLRNRLTERWAKQEEQVVHLGASTIPSAYILPELLPAYRRRQPEIRFDIHQSDSQGVIDGLLRGSFEVGLVGFQGQEPSVEYTPFYRDAMVLITPVTPHFCRIQDRGGITLEEMIAEPILLREQGSGSKKYAQAYFEEMGGREEDLHVTARLNDQESIKNLVAGGLGISVISAKAAENFRRDGRLLTFPLPGARVDRLLYLAVRKNDFLSDSVRQFLEFARTFYVSDRETKAAQGGQIRGNLCDSCG